jgi:ABC-type multidrug transport system permease subunit
MYWMMHRQYMLLRRSPSLTFGRVMPTAIFSLIVGSLFYLIGDTQASARTRVGALFFAVAQLVFSAFALVNVVFSQRSIYYMQKKNRYFKPAMFPITFFLADFPITVLNALVYCLIVYPMIGFVNGINSVNFVYFFLMGVLMSATGRAWAFFLASAIPIEAAASVVAPVRYIYIYIYILIYI